MKDILLLVHDDAGQEARLLAAIDLVHALGGHLRCLDVAVASPHLEDAYGIATIATADARKREADNRTRIEPRLQARHIRYVWIDTLGFLSNRLREAAVSADLIVLNRQLDPPFPDMEEVVSSVLIESGKPVVAVPPDATGFDAAGHALIAWDGSAQSEAAIRTALPLLQRARGVTIIEVDDGSIGARGDEPVAFLSRHGVPATLRREPARGRRTGPVLLAAVTSLGPAYLVMGGFGHNRFVEALLGGVTRRMLLHSPVPLFLAR